MCTDNTQFNYQGGPPPVCTGDANAATMPNKGAGATYSITNN